MGRIYPDWDDLNGLRTPLTNGERALAQFLDEQLPQQWRIYVQPYVNDMRPDIVVMNPWVGMVVFEVKDWDISVAIGNASGTKDGERSVGSSHPSG
jgi:hypothetical protein